MGIVVGYFSLRRGREIPHSYIAHKKWKKISHKVKYTGVNNILLAVKGLGSSNSCISWVGKQNVVYLYSGMLYGSAMKTC